jgi:hypothetical protein
MQNSDLKITTHNCNQESMSYYLKTRETIHGLDQLIASAIAQSVTMITASLTLGVILYEKIDNPLHSTLLALLLTFIAFLITYNAQRRITFYSQLLEQTVNVAKKLEDVLIKQDEVKLSKQIEDKVQFAGYGGVRIYLRSIKVFYLIEIGLALYFLIFAIITLSCNGDEASGSRMLPYSISTLGKGIRLICNVWP